MACKDLVREVFSKRMKFGFKQILERSDADLGFSQTKSTLKRGIFDRKLANRHGEPFSGKVLDNSGSSGLLSVSSRVRIGMVGLFCGMIETIKNVGAELDIIEKNE